MNTTQQVSRERQDMEALAFYAGYAKCSHAYGSCQCWSKENLDRIRSTNDDDLKASCIEFALREDSDVIIPTAKFLYATLSGAYKDGLVFPYGRILNWNGKLSCE